MTERQRDIFLGGEADAWFTRNAEALAARPLSAADPVLAALLDVLDHPLTPRPARVLEIGCGDGRRLAWLAAARGILAHGLDPSGLAVAAARGHGIDARQGTAEALPFDRAAFDIVLFGFCLYVCDRADLFQIAAETHRVLAPEAWIVLHDFYAEAPHANPNHHRPGLMSYKMDTRRLFDWHPAYHCHAHRLMDHTGAAATDSAGDWTAVSTLRKRNGADAA